MPWEIDMALLNLMQLKRSSYYIPSDVKIILDFTLNLSGYYVDWTNSILPKKYFMDKYESYKHLADWAEFSNFRVYDGDSIYGHIDSAKNIIEKNCDAYITMCPDIYFSETLLGTMCELALQIENEYYIITPQITKLWDETWDILVNENFMKIDYSKYKDVECFDVDLIIKESRQLENRTIIKSPKYKWAGWFDLYNKKYFEKLVPIPHDWTGYGQYDFYSMIIMECLNHSWPTIDFQQYIIEGEIICDYRYGKEKQEKTLVKPYNEYICRKNKDHSKNKRKFIEENMVTYANLGINHALSILKEGKIQ